MSDAAGDDCLHSDLERAARARPDAVAIRAGDEVWTFAALEARAELLAAYLSTRGVCARDRVAVLLTNRVEFVVVVHAVSKLGAASVLLSPAWKAFEIDHALSITEPRLAVTERGLATGTAVHLADHVIDIDDPAVWAPTTQSPERGSPGADHDAILVFSSGTTGLPKAVRHTHASMHAATRHWCDALGLSTDDRFQVATPPSHILGLLNLLAAIRAGASVRLHPRFDLDEILRCIEAEHMTLEMAVAPIALAMANHPDIERFDLSSLRYVMWGATPVTASVAQEVSRRTGVRWLPAYGASELPVLAANPVDDPSAWRLDSAGLAPPGVELRVCDLETGDVVAAETVGEIQARSPSVMVGYLPADATADAFTGDGWYRTGDVGWLEPDGWVHLTDRCKEMLKVNGFQVAPAEIEAVLHGHPSVVDCAVFGVPDERAGEVPVAAVQLDPGRGIESDELCRLVGDTLATYKQPRAVVVVDSIPRLPSGKVLRRTLRDEWVHRTGIPEERP